ncbi:LCP family protein [Actinocatenispora comari]|jgi:LCP family protein required for cell wall assembly|uniref:Cell envelope-related transcriptional attenuator domain-containing protein n=1 Tax=Actinocatenispora comari TaxID=2807577 RepID=A0A8J4EKB5_9ACTN|nr:LCP family protein [Actinocatenispora comari]GIL27216.1 hypothetical protein NUM_24700 [Actinocatenispora comari]
MAGRRRARSPWWARLCLVAGIVLTLASGASYAGTVLVTDRVDRSVPQADLLGDGGGRTPGSRVTGPLDILLAGSDLRRSWHRHQTENPRTDTIMWLHVPASYDHAYLLSIPRDLEVPIPYDPRTGRGGVSTKINAAFAWGMTGVDDVTGGMQNLHATLRRLTGESFSMAALVNWDGFTAIVSELGGVTLCVDRTFTSTQPTLGHHTFRKGCHHYDAELALALVRERYAYADSDYGRQRMQQQFIKQILQRATSAGVLTSPTKIDKVVGAAGKALTMDRDGYRLVDLVLALRRITPDAITSLQIAHTTLPDYNEQLVQPVDGELFRAMRTDRMDGFVLAHPELVAHGRGLGR